MNTAQRHVREPSGRLEELAEILAVGLMRVLTQKSSRKKSLTGESRSTSRLSRAVIRPQPAMESRVTDTVLAQLSALKTAHVADLKQRWRDLFDREPPPYNRRFLEEMLDRLCTDAERRKTSVSAIMLDLDHFKMVNDQHGHAAGDAVLREVATAIVSCLRSVDVACRYGGEEFAIILPDCSVANAAAKAEQIRSRINERTTASGLAVTVSLGVASIPETCGGQVELIPEADAALYAAKQQGRDRVVVAPLRTLTRSLSLVET